MPRKFIDQGYKNLMPVHGKRAYLLRFLEICGDVFALRLRLLLFGASSLVLKSALA